MRKMTFRYRITKTALNRKPSLWPGDVKEKNTEIMSIIEKIYFISQGLPNLFSGLYVYITEIYFRMYFPKSP